MSNVQQKYRTVPSANIRLGTLSLEEYQTRFRDINDLFRQLMADIRQESNEARSLISANASRIATVQSATETAAGEANEAKALSNTFASQIAQLQSTASQAASAASAAEQTAQSAMQVSASVQAVAASVDVNASAITALTSRVQSLENAAATDAALVTVDGDTVDNTNGVLKALDVQVGEEDYASGRGQIGRTSIQTGIDLNELVLDGWYAVGGTGATGMPTGVTSGVCRVSSAYAEGSIVQCLWTGSVDACRAFIRFGDGTNWSGWLEQMSISSLGNGLTVDNGVVAVDFSDVLPEVGDYDSGKVLSADGAWVERVTREQLDVVASNVDELAGAVSDLNSALEAVEASVAAEPDGTTLLVVDGQYTVPTYLGATEEADGIAGLVPAAEAGGEDKYLRADGTWADPALETATFDGSDVGLVPAPEEGEEGFLKSDGSWADPCGELETRVEALEAVNALGLSDRISVLEYGEGSASIDAIFAEPAEEEQEGE